MKRETVIAAGAALGLVGVAFLLSEGEAEASTEPKRGDVPPLPPPVEPTTPRSTPPMPPQPPPPSPPAPPPAPPLLPPPPAPPKTGINTSDDYAMGRMFESETGSDEARIVIGYISMQVARRRGIALFDLFTSPQFVYGPRVLGGISRYASTAKEPTPATAEFAKLVVSGQLVPSLTIRVEPITAWVEWLRPKDKGAEERAQELIDRQNDFGPIWRRITGTSWFLYSRNGKKITATKGHAAAALQKVPQVSAVDRG